MKHQNGLFKAIKYFGSQQALANAIGASQRTISYWLNREKRIPYKYAVNIFYKTKGHISLNELAPENFEINCQIEQQFYLSLNMSQVEN
jgi:DNA-binding transcriptional regulator YdaS (Cro superfamily)